MDFNRNDLIEYFGNKKEAQTRFIALRRSNTGYFKMVRESKSGNRHGSFAAIRSMVHFEPDEIIEHFSSMIDDAKKRGLDKKPYVKQWKKNIELAIHFKELDYPKTA